MRASHADSRKAVSTTAAAIIVIVILIAALAGIYTVLSQPAATSSSSTSVPSSSTSSHTSSTTSTPTSVTSSSAFSLPCTNNATLYAAAKQEGTVYLYSSQTIQQLNATKALFEKDCPGITLQFERLVGGPLLVRIQSEVASGKHVGDIAMGTAPDMAALKNGSYVINYVPPNSKNILPQFKDPAGSVYFVRTPYYVIAYNTNLVNQSSVPKSWMDLTKPQWQGKLALADPYSFADSQSWFFVMKQVLGNNWTTFVNGLHAQHPLMQVSLTPVAQVVAAGQAAVGITLTSSVYPLLQQHAPIAVAAVGPLVALQTGVVLLAGAPHPNAARVFENWLLSNSSMQFFASYGDPTGSGLAPPVYSNLTPLAQYVEPVLTSAQTQQLIKEMGLPWTS